MAMCCLVQQPTNVGEDHVFFGVTTNQCREGPRAATNQQPTNNQPTNNQPTTNQQPTNNQPTTNQQPTNTPTNGLTFFLLLLYD
jgi:outer membrane protein insertion porin family